MADCVVLQNIEDFETPNYRMVALDEVSFKPFKSR